MKIVNLDAYTIHLNDLNWNELAQLGDLVTYDRVAPEDVIPAIENAEAVFTSKVKFTKAVIDAAPNLKFIGVTATGYDNIDLDAAKARGIAVCNVPAYSTESVAQHTFALILEITNHVGHYTELVHEHQWEKSLDFTFIDRPLTQLSGRSLGIIGYGSIGKRVAWIAEAFGIPKFIVGATVVSFATTLPEMLVSVFAALEGNADIAVGNAVGSVTANTGLIMCLSLVCMPCLMTRKQFGFKASLLLATIAVLFAFTRNGQLSVAQSVVILLFFAAFLAENLMAGKREHGAENAENRPQMTGKALACNLLGFVLGAATIVLGAQLLIDNGSALAKMIGVPDSIIAATMIAIGTSLPELVTTLTAIRKKESSLSVGNIIGANIMDLTLIMPLCSLIQGRAMLVERQGMLLDIPACLIVTSAALVPALISGRFKRWTGFLIGGLYIAYLAVMFTCFGV